MPPGVYSWGTDEAASSVTSCIAAAMDVNGSKKPNTIAEDIQLINANGFGSSCYYEIGNVCLGAPSLVPAITTDECIAKKDEFGIQHCSDGTGSYTQDYWAAAVIHCGGVDKLPTSDELLELMKYLFGFERSTYNFDNHGSYNLSLGTINETARLGLPEGDYFYLWAREEAENNSQGSGIGKAASYRAFKFANKSSDAGYLVRYNTGIYTMCKN